MGPECFELLLTIASENRSSGIGVGSFIEAARTVTRATTM